MTPRDEATTRADAISAILRRLLKGAPALQDFPASIEASLSDAYERGHAAAVVALADQRDHYHDDLASGGAQRHDERKAA